MAKLALVCLRNGGPHRLQFLRERMTGFLESLRPDNLPGASVTVNDDGSGVLLGVFNPAEPAAIQGCSAYAGWLAESKHGWSQPGTDAPEGTYALLRTDARRVELLTDYCGSRTLWYAQTPDIFVASTSQRAIPWFTGAFDPNPQAILWMLSSGSIGPGHSWDKRVCPIPPGGRVRLDRDTWRLDVHEPTVELHTSLVGDPIHHERLREALRESLGSLEFDWSRWILPLSGGFDSRLVLLWLNNRKGLRTITWGTPQAPQIRGSDAWVAPQVAKALGVSHEYLELEPVGMSPERVLHRFVLAGEARVDHISGYMDGFRLWSELAQANVAGVVRGDESFGYKAVRDARGARFRAGLILWEDHVGLPHLQDLDLGHLGEQRIPDSLWQRQGESPADWRDRLYSAFRIPAILAALSELKSAYVEIANPLLLRRIAELARTLPAHLRTDKRLAREVASKKGIAVPFADSIAIASPEEALESPGVMHSLIEELASSDANKVFPPAYLVWVTGPLQELSCRVGSPKKRSFKRDLRRLLPRSLVSSWTQDSIARVPSVRRLALRTILVTRIAARLRQDAAAQ
jgi:asparagine synthetase B (glutamine-hydrolysing)